MIQVGLPEGMSAPAPGFQVDEKGYAILSDADISKIAQRVRDLVKGACPCCGYPNCGHTHPIL